MYTFAKGSADCVLSWLFSNNSLLSPVYCQPLQIHGHKYVGKQKNL